MKNMSHKKAYALVVILAVVALFVVSPMPSDAQVNGSLYISPSTGAYTIGATFTVSIRVNTAGQGINAADGFIKYNPAELSVVGVSQGGSIFNLWTSQPAFSNTAGSISFSGGTPTPYSGSGGSIMTVTFRALREGASVVRFQEGSILAADGRGTNILGSLGSGTYTISAKSVVPTAPQVAPRPNTPVAPDVMSKTHPEQSAWYKDANPLVEWALGGGITGVRTLIDQKETTIPTQVQSSSATSASFEALADGIWYFHVQLRNVEGWGGVSHYRIQIDSVDPTTFDIVEIPRDDNTKPRVSFELRGEDDTSGLSYYDIQIDGDNTIRYEDEGSTGIYRAEPQEPGTHTILITAYDAAGNAVVDIEQFYVNAIGEPRIIEYTEQLRESDIFVVRGETFQNATVMIYVGEADLEPIIVGEVRTSVDGLFTFVADEKIPEGMYELTVRVTDDRGAKSRPSNALPVIVGPSVFQEVGEGAISFLVVAIPLLALLFLFVLLLWYMWHRTRVFLGFIEKETKEAEKTLHKQFMALQRSLREHIASLEHASTKRELTREEERISEELTAQLEEAEKAILGELTELEEDIIVSEHPIKKWLRRMMRR